MIFVSWRRERSEATGFRCLLYKGPLLPLCSQFCSSNMAFTLCITSASSAAATAFSCHPLLPSCPRLVGVALITAPLVSLAVDECFLCLDSVPKTLFLRAARPWGILVTVSEVMPTKLFGKSLHGSPVVAAHGQPELPPQVAGSSGVINNGATSGFLSFPHWTRLTSFHSLLIRHHEFVSSNNK